VIRRTAITVLFFAMGFGALLVFGITQPWLCEHMPVVCKMYSGPCPGIDICVESRSAAFAIVLFYLGPSIGFGITGFLTSAVKVSASVWLTRSVAAFVVCYLALLVLMRIA
jgi:hypothetical protein